MDTSKNERNRVEKKNQSLYINKLMQCFSVKNSAKLWEKKNMSKVVREYETKYKYVN